MPKLKPMQFSPRPDLRRWLETNADAKGLRLATYLGQLLGKVMKAAQKKE